MSGNIQSRQAPTPPVFEDIEIGMTIPPLTKKPTTVTCFMFSGALWITHRIHYDQAYARSEGHKDILVHGPLQAAYLIQLLTDWMQENCTLRKISYRNQSPVYPEDVLTCTGVVKEKYVDNKGRCLSIDLNIENQNKQGVTTGSAIVYVPSR